MSPVVTFDEVLGITLDDIAALERAWHGPDNTAEKSVSKINSATLTVLRNSNGDFQDRQVFLYVDGELWGKGSGGSISAREVPTFQRFRSVGVPNVRTANTGTSATMPLELLEPLEPLEP